VVSPLVSARAGYDSVIEGEKRPEGYGDDDDEISSIAGRSTLSRAHALASAESARLRWLINCVIGDSERATGEGVSPIH
jgi:hypothetical protein